MTIAPALGALIGMSLALTGAGGGILAVPALVFGLRLTVSQAAPVGLLAVGLAAAAGATVGLRNGSVRYRAVAVIGGAGMLAAPIGTAISSRLPTNLVTAIFALVLGAVALRMYRTGAPGSSAVAQRALPGPVCVRDSTTGRFVWTRVCARCLALTGLGAGTLSGLLGVGGGFLIVPALTRNSDLQADGIVNTSLAVIAMVSISGVAAATAQGHMDWSVALPFALGATVALLAGQHLARRWSGRTLRRCFAFVSGAASISLLVRAAHAI